MDHYNLDIRWIPKGYYTYRYTALDEFISWGDGNDILVSFWGNDQFNEIFGSSVISIQNPPILTIPEIIRIKRDMVINNILNN